MSKISFFSLTHYSLSSSSHFSSFIFYFAFPLILFSRPLSPFYVFHRSCAHALWVSRHFPKAPYLKLSQGKFVYLVEILEDFLINFRFVIFFSRRVSSGWQPFENWRTATETLQTHSLRFYPFHPICIELGFSGRIDWSRKQASLYREYDFHCRTPSKAAVSPHYSVLAEGLQNPAEFWADIRLFFTFNETVQSWK